MALSGTITAISLGMHAATTRRCLIASPSLSLAITTSLLCTGLGAVDLASIALTTDKNLGAAAGT
jgi:hypothetical protein